MRKIQLKRLRSELSVTQGMIAEITIKCRLLVEKLHHENCDTVLCEQQVHKFNHEIGIYKRKLNRITEELGEVYGTPIV